MTGRAWWLDVAAIFVAVVLADLAGAYLKANTAWYPKS